MVPCEAGSSLAGLPNLSTSTVCERELLRRLFRRLVVTLMSIKYVKVNVSIHGLDATGDGIKFLRGYLREATLAALKGNNKDEFRWRDDLDSDLEVEIEEVAGNDDRVQS